MFETVSNYALEGQDAGALSDEDIRSIFTGDEYEELVHRIRLELLPRLEDVRREWENDDSPAHSPGEHMQPLLEYFGSLLVQFAEDPTSAGVIDREMCLTKEWIEDNEVQSLDRSPRQLGEIEATDSPESTRSIFDDIDADEKP